MAGSHATSLAGFEEFIPLPFNFLRSAAGDRQDFRQIRRIQPEHPADLTTRDPEFRFASAADDMNMARLFPLIAVKEETETALTKQCRHSTFLSHNIVCHATLNLNLRPSKDRVVEVGRTNPFELVPLAV